MSMQFVAYSFGIQDLKLPLLPNVYFFFFSNPYLNILQSRAPFEANWVKDKAEKL